MGVLLVAITFYYIKETSKGITWEDHSQTNMIVANATMISMLLGTATIIASYKLFKYSRKAWCIVKAFLLLVLVCFYYVRVYSSCSHLQDPIQEPYRYEESGEICKWKKSGICWHYATFGLFKPVFWFINNDCAKESTDVTIHRKAAGSNKIAGFKLTTKIEPEERKYFREVQKYLMDNMESVTPLEMERGPLEVFIDFRKRSAGELKIKLKKLDFSNRETKVENHDLDHPNILRIFIDTVSRPRFIRRYANTKAFFKKFHFSKNKKLRSYEFFRFHSLRGYTYPNLISSTYGNFRDHQKVQMKRVEQFAREKGYVTGLASDLCSLIENEYTKGFGGAKFPDDHPLDHELFQISCDYHNHPIDGSLFFIGRGPYSASKNCYMGKDLGTPHLDYAL